MNIFKTDEHLPLTNSSLKILMIHGTHDRVIPYWNSQFLLELLVRKHERYVRLKSLYECGHNDMPDDEIFHTIDEYF